MKAATLCFVSIVATVAFAADPGAALGSKVRIQASGIDAGWHTGTLKKGGECTMVFLDKATPDGYTALALNALSAMEIATGAAWTVADVKTLLAKEPKDCREAAND